ncbi:MAG: TetR/AcrR family transcriptional regulator [Actinomycetota bacterium]
MTPTVRSEPARTNPEKNGHTDHGTHHAAAASGLSGVAVSSSMPARSRHEPRRVPEQARSKQRIDDICAAAMRLIAERGADAITISDIAAASKMSHSSVYRYFPTKQAIIKHLATERYDELRTRLAAGMRDDLDSPERMLHGLREYIAEHQRDPYLSQLRAAVRANPDLAALDLDDSRANARLLADALRDDGVVTAEASERRVLLVLELLDSVIHLTARTPPIEAVALIDDFIDLAGRHVFGDRPSG